MKKKLLKILGYLILSILVLVGIVILYFNNRYNTALENIKKEQTQLVNSDVEFFKFELKPPPFDQPKLLPVPKKIQWNKGEFKWPKEWRLSQSADTDISNWIERSLPQEVRIVPGNGNIIFRKNTLLASQAYILDIQPSRVNIQYNTSEGLHYALTTLSQLITLYPNSITSIHIEDKPDLEVRGIMIDISRDKVPTLATLYEMIDQLSLLKYNHVQLYVEGFSFGYPSFKELWEGKETPITPEEVRLLDLYCKERFIELAANQNSLGHMTAWLETETYADLAECPDGFALLPMLKMKSTLDPQDPGSLQLVQQMMDDMAPVYSSKIFNVNLDEPFELGHCKSEELAEEIGVGQIYLNYTKKIYDHTKKHKKEMWMWGDIVGKHPEIIDQLPKDITLLEWGYEYHHPFDENTTRIKEAGLDFLVCPGTSSWMSITGRTDNMLGNISTAVRTGLKNGAKGMLLTDWGDLGHWQYLPVSFPGIAYGAGVSWNVESDHNLPLEDYMNTFMLKDEKKELASVIMDMGRYNHFEDISSPNMTSIFMTYQLGLTDQVLQSAGVSAMQGVIRSLINTSMAEEMQARLNNKKVFEYDKMITFLDNLSEELNQPEMQLTEVNIVRDELGNGIEMVKLGAAVKNYGAEKYNLSDDEQIAFLQEMKKMVVNVQGEHQRLWLLRNKSGGLDRSLKTFRSLEASIDKEIDIAQSSGFAKSIDRLKNKVIAGGADWFLRD